MAKITVKNDNMSFEMPDGARLLHFLWDKTAFPQGCETGEDVICACVILKGEENLNHKTQQEINTLAKANFPNSKRNRLACQIIVLSGEIELEY